MGTPLAGPLVVGGVLAPMITMMERRGAGTTAATATTTTTHMPVVVGAGVGATATAVGTREAVVGEVEVEAGLPPTMPQC